MTENQVIELWKCAHIYDIPVECYGLRTQFNLKFFTGSGPLFEKADVIEKLQNYAICSKCGEEATISARRHNDILELYNEPGERTVIDGANDFEYIPLCSDCYLKEMQEKNG